MRDMAIKTKKIPPRTLPTTAPTGKSFDDEELSKAAWETATVVVTTTYDSDSVGVVCVSDAEGDVTTKKSIQTRLP